MLYTNTLEFHVSNKTTHFNKEKSTNLKGFSNFLILFGNDSYLKEDNVKGLLKNYLIKPFIIYFGVNDLNIGKYVNLFIPLNHNYEQKGSFTNMEGIQKVLGRVTDSLINYSEDIINLQTLNTNDYLPKLQSNTSLNDTTQNFIKNDIYCFNNNQVNNPLIDNFYITDSITKLSPNMNTATQTLSNKSNFN